MIQFLKPKKKLTYRFIIKQTGDVCIITCDSINDYLGTAKEADNIIQVLHINMVLLMIIS